MRKLLPAILILSLFSFSLGALELTETADETQTEARGFFRNFFWFLDMSVLFFPEKNGMGSDPMPVLPSPGAGIAYKVTNIFRLELTLDFYLTHYGYNYTLNRAVPAAIENRSARVISSLLGFQAAAYFNVNSFMTVRVYGGPAADLRIVVVAAGLNAIDMDDAKKQTNSVRNYFWSSGRWFMPVMGAGLDFAISPRFRMGIDLRIWAPFYRAWTREKAPAIEGWRFGPGIRFSFM